MYKNCPNEQETREKMDESVEDDEAMSKKAKQYVSDLLSEKIVISKQNLPIASRLVDEEVSKAQLVGRPPPKERYIDLYREKPIKLSTKVILPVKQHPKFNFVGKLLGPKGNTLKRLQEETLCRISINGRGSMKDREREEELRNSLDPKYGHLADDLHVEITTVAPAAEAYGRMSFALSEFHKFIIPDKNDEISLEQMMEMDSLSREQRFFPKPGFPRPPLGRRPAPSSDSVPAQAKIRALLNRSRMAMEQGYGSFENEREYSAPGFSQPPHDWISPPPKIPGGQPRAKVLPTPNRPRAVMEQSYGGVDENEEEDISTISRPPPGRKPIAPGDGTLGRAPISTGYEDDQMYPVPKTRPLNSIYKSPDIAGVSSFGSLEGCHN